MKPIQELLHRIRWDQEYAKADFEIGYYDRVADRLLSIPFSTLSFPADDPFSFEVFGRDGMIHRVPFHRIKALYRNGQCIWHRQSDTGRSGRPL